MKFQVITMKVREGISKANNPYKMLNVSGIFTGDDGVVELGEISFFDRDTAPIPNNLVVGATYTPVLSARNIKGSLTFEVSALVALAKASA